VLPLEDINARQMLKDAHDLLQQIDPRREMRQIDHLVDVSSTKSALGGGAADKLLGVNPISV
jgi:hypothetical protein